MLLPSAFAGALTGPFTAISLTALETIIDRFDAAAGTTNESGMHKSLRGLSGKSICKMRISGVGIARAGKKIRGQIDKKDKQFEHNSLKETVKEQKIEKAISIYERTAAPVPFLAF